jgi:beta-glucosidase
MTLLLTGETLPPGTTGVPYSQSIASQASGGTPPYTFAEVSGGPDTITVSPTGTITLTPGASMANPSKVSWTDPTTNVDGTAIAAGEITGYLVGVRLASGTAGTYAYTASAPATSASELLNLLIPVLPTGASLIAAVQALSTTNGNSAWSVESAPFELLTAPNPPTGLVVS